MDQPVLSFRSSFWTLWRWTTLVFGTIVALVVGIVASLNGVEIHLAVVTTSVYTTLFGALTVVWAVDSYLVVDLSADGIRCPRMFGYPQFAPWPTIEQIRPINVLGLRYLRVRSSATRRPLWVPLFLSDMP